MQIIKQINTNPGWKKVPCPVTWLRFKTSTGEAALSPDKMKRNSEASMNEKINQCEAIVIDFNVETRRDCQERKG
jgi:hypothetical protein